MFYVLRIVIIIITINVKPVILAAITVLLAFQSVELFRCFQVIVFACWMN